MQCTTVPRVKYLDVNNLLSIQRKASIISMTFLYLLDIDAADVILTLYFASLLGCCHKDQRSDKVAHHLPRFARFQEWCNRC